MQQKKRGLFRTTSRLLLRKKDDDQLAVEAALAKAKVAVLHDSAGNIDHAIAAYTETVELLSQVKDKALIKIHDTYAQRIKVLAASNNGGSGSIRPQQQQQHTDDPAPSLCMTAGGEESDGSQPPTPSSTSSITDRWVIRNSPSSSSTTTTTSTTSSSSGNRKEASATTILNEEEKKIPATQQPPKLFLSSLPTTTISTEDDVNDHDDIVEQQHKPTTATTTNQSSSKSSSCCTSYYWAMMKRLKQSMVQGGYITDRLYVPKQLWYNQQGNSTLPNLDHKLALAEHLLGILKSLKQQQSYHQKMDAMRTMKALQALEEALIKAPCSSIPPMATAVHSPSSSSLPHGMTTTIINNTTKKWRASLGRQIQAASAWKNSKFVDRIRPDHHTAPKMIDDRYHMYIRTLIKLFSAAQILDAWHAEYSMDRNTSIHQQILVKIELCADMLGHIVCTNVLNDFKILWEAWVDRGNQYMDD